MIDFKTSRLKIALCLLVQDIFDSDWYTSRNLIGGADIIVIKYNVNDKFSFHEVKDNYIPVIKRALNSVPVIIAAVGTRQNGKYLIFCAGTLLITNGTKLIND